MRILIANPFGVGDVLFSLPLVHALREAHPGGFLGYLCNRRTAEMVSSWPFLSWHRVFEKDEFRKAWRRSKREGLRQLRGLLRSVAEARFDVLLDLSLGWQYGLGGALAGIPRRIGFDFRQRGRFLTDRIPIDGFHDQPVAEYYLSLLSALDLPRPRRIRSSFELPDPVAAQAEQYLASQGARPEDRLVGMVPGGGASWGPNASFKQWPAGRFVELADEIGRRFQARILLMGSAQEEALCRAIDRALRVRPLTAIQVPSLLLLAGLLRRCEWVVGNDSGPLHLAAAVGVKTVTIFGPVDPSVYGPFPSLPTQRIVVNGLACRPCYHSFRFPPCPWDNACLKRLPTSWVMEAVAELIPGGAG